MNLILSYGYPFPYPDGLSEAQQEEISMAAPAYRLVLKGVTHFEQKHTTTIQFRDADSYLTAKAITGWAAWSDLELVLEAPSSAADGYDYPAILVGSVAYCGHQLVAVPDGAAAVLKRLLDTVDKYNDALNLAEIAPDGDNYNELLDLIDDVRPVASAQ